MADFVCHVYHIVAFSVHDVDYSRNTSCALNLISTFYYSQGIDTFTGGLVAPQATDTSTGGLLAPGYHPPCT